MNGVTFSKNNYDGVNINSLNYKKIFSDFDNGIYNDVFLRILNSGTGSTIACDSTDHTANKAVGVVYMSTGTTATGSVRFMAMDGNYCKVGTGGILSFESRSKIRALSTAAEEYSFKSGFYNATTISGCYFEYLRTNSVNWHICCAISNVITKVDTGIAVDTNFHVFKVEINELGTLATFYMDGVVVGSIATNMPTTVLTAPGFVLNKTVGITAVNVDLDWYLFEGSFPNR
jgi:hypothetical protein